MTSVTRICSISHCGRQNVYARGMCGLHYNRWLKGIPMDLPPRPWGSTGCTHPGCERPYSHKGYCEMHAKRHLKGADMDAPIQGPSGFSTCQVLGCEKPHESRGMCRGHSYTARNYHLSIKAIEELEASNCDICGDPPPSYRNLAVDHDHACCPGKRTCGACIRGFLCQGCNQGIGMFRDSPELLTKAIKYLNVAHGGSNVLN